MPGQPASSRGKALKGKVSVVIPVEPGGSVQAALKALKVLPKAEKALICEVLVAEGRNPSRQRNQAVEQAKGEFIHFIDSDSRVLPGALPLFLKAVQAKAVATVGGPNVAPEDESPVGRAFDRILGSWLGSFTSAARYRAIGVRRDCSEKELILCNLFFKREAYLKLGGLREDLYPNEENELFNRVLAGGFRLVYEPQAQVERPRRQTLTAFSYQAFRYGRGRMQQIRTGFHASDWVNLAPLGLLACYTAAASLGLVRGPGLWAELQWGGLGGVLLFTALSAWSSLFTVRFQSPLQQSHLLWGYPARHLAYAVGLLFGLVQGPRLRPLEVRIRRQHW